jgi:hypothetical protein
MLLSTGAESRINVKKWPLTQVKNLCTNITEANYAEFNLESADRHETKILA